VQGEKSSCDQDRAIKSTSLSGYFTSTLAEERGPGSSQCPWMIEARPGQHINVTLYSFAQLSSDSVDRRHEDSQSRPRSGYGPLRPDVCFEIAMLRDGDATKPVTVCGDENRQIPLLWSDHSVVSIELSNPKLVQSLGTFVFHFQGKKRTDDKLIKRLLCKQFDFVQLFTISLFATFPC